jgi:short-subunit dehydrogenase
LRLYGESLRARLLGTGVGISVVLPGFFASAMSDRYDGPRPLIVSADAMAARIVRGLDRGAARIVAPWTLGALLRLLDLLPAAIGDRLIRVHRFRIDPES